MPTTSLNPTTNPTLVQYGTPTAPDAPIPLRAGPLALVFSAGDLRYITLGDTEIIRRIYVAVRDQDWGTIPATLSNLTIDDQGDHFTIDFDAQHSAPGIEFGWHGAIRGSAGGDLDYSMDGAAQTSFWRNRIGICVLHPASCAGNACIVEQVNGTQQRGRFPLLISPHQPFLEMRAIRHYLNNGQEGGPSVEARFEGDAFEMEDQRNWTDASYKTYSTPLRIPYPVEVHPGDKVQQAVQLRLHDLPLTQSYPAPAAISAPSAVEITVGAAQHDLPALGLGVAAGGAPFTGAEAARLAALHLSHLRVDLYPDRPNLEQDLAHASLEARALGVGLEIALYLTNAAEAELAGLAALLERLRPRVARWLVFSTLAPTTPGELVYLARGRLGGYAPDVPIGGGTAAYFTELNRNRPPADALDCVAYSLNPQVHAFDRASLVETLAGQTATAASAAAFCDGKPLVVSPVTLRPRIDPNATGAEITPPAGELPADVDPRQMSLFAAGWTLGSINALGSAGVAAVTYYETTGWRGVMERAQGTPLPDRFASLPGSVYPVYHLLADVGEFAGGKLLAVTTSAPLAVQALALAQDSRRRLLVVNLTFDDQTVTLHGLPAQVALHTLDAATARAAMLTPEDFRAAPAAPVVTDHGGLTLKLPPMALVRLDSSVE
ncbi:MAG: hypothetical protein IT329_19975 [Caldilineaceae bacterium]|nr:hypothetical protein [Caldilineaceae bacterium]